MGNIKDLFSKYQQIESVNKLSGSTETIVYHGPLKKVSIIQVNSGSAPTEVTLQRQTYKNTCSYTKTGCGGRGCLLLYECVIRNGNH